MQTLAIDGRTGASGDMLLGALLAAGADRAALAPVEEGLNVEYAIEQTTRAGVGATAVTVRDSGEADEPAEGHGPHRGYEEVVEIVESLGVPEPVAARAERIFGILAESEAAVHGTDRTEVAFHEIGADDAIADVVGVCLLLESLAPDRIVTTPLAAGSGEREMTHGTYPIPAPAVVEVAARADWELRGGPVEAELLTPTGAAILAAVAEGVETIPAMAVSTVGRGAGSRSLPDRPNVLRALFGQAGGLEREPIAVLETNLDDASPELLGGLQETLTDAGAVDVSILPATMKKSRPGHLVKAIVPREETERVAARLAEETGTLGVRATPATHRFVADRTRERTTVEIDGEDHELAVKIARTDDGTVFDVSAEFDDASRVAAATGRPIRAIMRRAEERVRAEHADA